MRIEVLFLDGCPNHEPAVARLKAVLMEEGILANVEEVDITNTPFDHGSFPGSPTIRINGRDIDPLPPIDNPAGLTCRVYGDGRGVPSRDVIRRAIRVAQEARHE